MSYLICLHGSDHGKEWNLTAGKLRIGRALGNEVVLRDPKVSRNHCVLLLNGDAIVLEDLHSRNGTKVDGKPVASCLLHFDQIVQVGDSTFTVSRENLRARVSRILRIPEGQLDVFVKDQADVLFNVLARDEGHARSFVLN
jgi:pSer/pThr/pTyr-binding forkhead associated (FHA) protein